MVTLIDYRQYSAASLWLHVSRSGHGVTEPKQVTSVILISVDYYVLHSWGGIEQCCSLSVCHMPPSSKLVHIGAFESYGYHRSHTHNHLTALCLGLLLLESRLFHCNEKVYIISHVEK